MTRPAMTGQQAEALAVFLVSLRPGQRRWTKASVYDALTAAAANHTPDAETLARAAIRAALTPSIVGPEVIPMPGAHWESVNHSPAHEPARARRCDQCHGFHMPDAPHDPSPSQSFASYIQTMRAITHDAKRPVDRTRTLLDTYDDTELPEGDVDG